MLLLTIVSGTDQSQMENGPCSTEGPIANSCLDSIQENKPDAVDTQHHDRSFGKTHEDHNNHPSDNNHPAIVDDSNDIGLSQDEFEDAEQELSMFSPWQTKDIGLRPFGLRLLSFSNAIG